MRRGVVGGLVCAVVFGLVLTASQAWAGDNDLNRNTAVLRWLDKATARVETFEVAVNDHVQMQTLEITVKACKQQIGRAHV